jgi:hypothetical protein
MNKVESTTVDIRKGVESHGRTIMRQVQRAFWATFVTAAIYYVVEPFFGFGSKVGSVLFVPLFMDFGVYTVLQFAERLLEPFLAWILRITGITWLVRSFGWLVTGPIGWAFGVIASFVRSLVTPQKFSWPAFPKWKHDADHENASWWDRFRGNFRKAVFETAATFVAYWFLHGRYLGQGVEQELLYWPIFYQMVRYTVTQFFARLLEPYVVLLAGRHLSELGRRVGNLCVPVLKGATASLVFVVQLLTANYAEAAPPPEPKQIQAAPPSQEEPAKVTPDEGEPPAA